MQTIIMVIDIRYIEIPVHGILHTTKSAKTVTMKIIDIPHKMIGVHWRPVKFPRFKIRVCPNRARRIPNKTQRYCKKLSGKTHARTDGPETD